MRRTNGSSIDFWCQVQGQAQREPVCHVEPPSRLAVRGVRRVVDFNGQIIETARDDAADEELSWQGPLFIGQSQKVVHPFLRECSTLVVKRNHVVVLAMDGVHLADDASRRRQQRDLVDVLRPADVCQDTVDVLLIPLLLVLSVLASVCKLSSENIDELNVALTQFGD